MRSLYCCSRADLCYCHCCCHPAAKVPHLRPVSRVFRGGGALAALLLVLLTLFGAAASPARAQYLAWAGRYNGPGNNTENLASNHCLAVDAQGNVYSTGISAVPGSELDWVTIKYNTRGERQWVTAYHGAAGNNDEPFGLVVDGQGDVYVTGFTTETADLSDVMTTIKYVGATGAQKWKQVYRSPITGNTALGVAISVNPAQPNSVYVTGSVTNGVSAASGYDIVTVRYDAASGSTRWIALYSSSTSSDSDIPIALGVDTQGNCFVTGYSTNSGIGDDWVTIKYAAATGAALWTRIFNGAGNSSDQPRGLVVDGQGNVTVTGYSFGGATTGLDYATVKYQGSNGAILWTQTYNNTGVNGGDMPQAIGADASGNIYVTGQSDGGNESSGTAPNNTGLDYVTIKYDGSSGGELWSRRFDGGFPTSTTNRADIPGSLVVDSMGNVTVTGGSYGGKRASGGTENDIATIRYNRNGIVQWTQRYNTNDTTSSTGSNSEQGFSLALDSQGSVYILGTVSTPTSALDLLTLKYDAGSVWTAQDIATGADNKTRFLWNRTDGAIALWTVTAAGTIEKSNTFGPYAGLTARAIAVGSDNKVRLLWSGGPGKATVWTVKADLSGTESGFSFTASGFSPGEIAVGPTDNLPRISWYDAGNRVAIWTLNGGTVTQSALFNAPVGYVDQAIAVGADNRTRLVWNKYPYDTAALWTLNATTPATVDTAAIFGPLNPQGTGWFAQDIATGTDNKPRLLWTNDTNVAALWQVSATSASTIEKGVTVGPLPMTDWVPTRIGFGGGSGSDGNVRLLWSAPTGAVLLWTVNPVTGGVVSTVGFGPL